MLGFYSLWKAYRSISLWAAFISYRTIRWRAIQLQKNTRKNTDNKKKVFLTFTETAFGFFFLGGGEEKNAPKAKWSQVIVNIQYEGWRVVEGGGGVGVGGRKVRLTKFSIVSHKNLFSAPDSRIWIQYSSNYVKKKILKVEFVSCSFTLKKKKITIQIELLT